MNDDQHADELHPNDLPLPAAQLEAAATYHAPPVAVPRDAMWTAIQARRADAIVMGVATTTGAEVSAPPMAVTHTTRGAISRVPRAARWLPAAATAAVMLIGISVWPRTPMPPAAPTVAAARDTTSTAVAWQVASAEHFGRAETMLTTLSASPQASGDRELSAWSRDLLESTRLLMDSPAGRDPKRRALLQELELVLVQLVESGPAMRAEDRTVMDEMLSRSALLLTRIRTTVPAGTSASRN